MARVCDTTIAIMRLVHTDYPLIIDAEQLMRMYDDKWYGCTMKSGMVVMMG